VTPERQRLHCCPKGVEHLLVQELIPQPGSEAFDEAILLRLARRDVVPADAALILPFEDRATCQFGSVVADHQIGFTVEPDHRVQLASNPAAGERGVCHERRAFARFFIDHREDAEPTVDAEPVGDEVQAPPLRRTRG